jgi:uncharacterized protein
MLSNLVKKRLEQRRLGFSVGTIQRIALFLTIIGALNWGLIGFFGINIVSAIFGVNTFIERTIYGIVGIAGLLSLSTLFQTSKAYIKRG